MKSDKYGNPIFQEKDLFDLIYQEIDLAKFSEYIFAENLDEFRNLSGIKFLSEIDQTIKIEEFDNNNYSNWFIDDNYKNMDIESFLVHVCPKQHYERLIEELQEFRKRNLLDLLRWLKYFVDICRKNNIIWGVGRGSSVASYTLYLLGVHKIDSVKYKLDFKEFMR